MYQSSIKNVGLLAEQPDISVLKDSLVGLEKETLRVNPEGGLAQSAHPASLGSALTHPYITTDYSEALLEIVTPPFTRAKSVLDFLSDTQHFIYTRLENNELLWATSMPCVVAGETSIPLAQYGTSNAGTMKTVYRRGLGHRYGRVMQVIAGVHFNFSFEEKFWPVYFRTTDQSVEFEKNSQQLISESYFAMLRNLQRLGWIIPYLFGASPAVCKSFLQGKETTLEEFNETTYYEPYATSLRMGDIGYQNNKESEVGVVANYNSLNEYVESLQHAIETPCPDYEKFGIEVNGKYQQLNSNILQIENEYYSTVRPKQILQKHEKPVDALLKRGVSYIELRSLDVNAFHPLGIDEEQINFLQVLMLFCLVQESPTINDNEKIEIDNNEMLTAHEGRDPALFLTRDNKKITIKQWGNEVFEAMRPSAELLNQVNQTSVYTECLEKQLKAINNPSLTPSAKMLREMQDNNEGFYQYAMRMSQQHYNAFTRQGLPEEKEIFYSELTAQSLQKQLEVEHSDTLPFATFIEKYFNNTLGQ